ncbi:YqzE family protein [Virgibacillus xinjiangensis]|uniref:YqzE family protein n=1 Tax=Virgibacillus xinjiangensis TaxID=393090 RepID=A0ABV7CRL1_9BACI
MSGNDYVKFVTQQLVQYMDQPPAERKKKKEKDQQGHPFYINRWLGVIPFAWKTIRKKAE